MRQICGCCEHTDGRIYASLPAQVRCTITNKYHLCDYVCDVDFVPVVRCKDCRFFQTDECRYDWPVQNVNDYCSKGERIEVVRCKDCAIPHNRWTGCPQMNGTIMEPDDYCSYGKRKEGEE